MSQFSVLTDLFTYLKVRMIELGKVSDVLRWI